MDDCEFEAYVTNLGKYDIPDEYCLGFVPEEAQSVTKDQIVAAMEAAGYYYDKLESADDNLRFFGEGGAVIRMGSWREAEDWLNGVVFGDPMVSDRVEAILHPERVSVN